MNTAVVVGNPKPKSRTLDAATNLVQRLTGAPPDVVLDVIDLGPSLLGWGDDGVKAAVKQVQACDLVVFASPTYKATFTGLLKCFLDQFPGGGLVGVTAVPLMLGAGPGHALAPELGLKPVLTELGATVPVRGLYLLETDYDSDDALGPWLTTWKSVLS